MVQIHPGNTETGQSAGECRLCGGELGKVLTLPEIMYGTGEKFDYAECARCETLQIVSIPPDMGRYYPNNYYSLSPRSGQQRLRTLTKSLIFNLGHIFPGSPVDRLRRRALPQWMFELQTLSATTRFLDVGCGRGAFLSQLAEWGFKRLEGVDPFVEKDVDNGLFKIRKAELAELEGTYDVVMMHHSLEHVADPAALLRAARQRLRPGGAVVVRIPVKGGFFWEHYGTQCPDRSASSLPSLHRRGLPRPCQDGGIRSGRNVL